MPLENLLDRFPLATKVTSLDDLFVYVLWVKAYVTDAKTFFGIGI